MNKNTPPIYRYSQLRYELTSPYRKGKGRKCRVWFLEDQRHHFWGDLLRDIVIVLTFTARRVFYWLKKEWRKEYLVGVVLLLALMPTPKRAQALVPRQTQPAYLKPIPKLSAVAPVAFKVPVEVQPIVPPPAPVVAPTPVYVAPVNNAPSGCVTGYSTGDYYLDKIISYESGGNSCATNPGGCYGLLQACPGEPLRAACGGNPSCQIAWFQANKTGGRSWAQVWAHEEQFGWW